MAQAAGKTKATEPENKGKLTALTSTLLQFKNKCVSFNDRARQLQELDSSVRATRDKLNAQYKLCVTETTRKNKTCDQSNKEEKQPLRPKEFNNMPNKSHNDLNDNGQQTNQQKLLATEQNNAQVIERNQNNKNLLGKYLPTNLFEVFRPPIIAPDDAFDPPP